MTKLYSTSTGALRLAADDARADFTALRLALQLAGGWALVIGPMFLPLDDRLKGGLILLGFVFASYLTALTYQEGRIWVMREEVAVRHIERLSELEVLERKRRLPPSPPTREIWRETPTGAVLVAEEGEELEGQGSDDVEDTQ